MSTRKKITVFVLFSIILCIGASWHLHLKRKKTPTLAEIKKEFDAGAKAFNEIVKKNKIDLEYRSSEHEELSKKLLREATNPKNELKVNIQKIQILAQNTIKKGQSLIAEGRITEVVLVEAEISTVESMLNENNRIFQANINLFCYSLAGLILDIENFSEELSDSTHLPETKKPQSKVSFGNIREFLTHKGKIKEGASTEEILQITELKFHSITNEELRFITQLKNLDELDLSECKISDIKPLQNLTELRRLNLSETQVVDIKPLQNLVDLRKLDLSEAQVVDISPLKNLTKLNILTLGEEVTDISPLINLSNLWWLILGHKVTDISPLKNLSNLQWLMLGSEVTDISSLENLSNLKKLSLGGNITDLSPLKNLLNLRELSLYDNSKITPLQIKELQKALPKCKINR